MPYRNAFRSYSSPDDVHMVSLPLNESLEQWPEQEMDFTSYAQFPSPTTVSKTAQAERPSDNIAYSQLMDLGSDVPSLDASRTSSIATSSLPASESELLAANLNLNPLPGSLPEKLCPLIAGEIDSCQPARCGPDAPCMNFANLPPIEDCTSVPCISSGSRSTTRDGVASPTITRQPEHVVSSRRQSNRRPSTRTPVSQGEESSLCKPQAQTGRVSRSRQQAPKEKAQSKVAAKQRAKAAHSLVEKKYRENLNTQLAMLHTTIQNAYYGPRRAEEIEPEYEFDAEMGPPSRSANAKFRKSEVLSDAMSYINQTEVEMRHMENEIQRLSEKVRMLEELENP